MPPAPKRVLLIEDDFKLASLVREYLEATGYQVLTEANGAQAPARILSEQPDIVLLDLMLPGLDGQSVCQQVRPKYKGPILMLTALGDERNEVGGFEAGADDYLVKPVRPRILLARIESLLRRTEGSASQSDLPTQIKCGDLEIDTTTREVKLRGVQLDLTTAELELLVYLARRAGQIVARDQIYREVRGIEWDGMDRSIDLRVTRLRRKLGDDARAPRIIKSVRGEGYLMSAHP
ncbi:MAG: response regulator transcription factor [Myxococcales bacterium]|jgi:two-component system response regulator RstA|nr:response regulator transcription factor [Myxococcales bacterium]